MDSAELNSMRISLKRSADLIESGLIDNRFAYEIQQIIDSLAIHPQNGTC